MMLLNLSHTRTTREGISKARNMKMRETMRIESIFGKNPVMCWTQCRVLPLSQFIQFSKEFQKAGSEKLFNLPKVTQLVIIGTSAGS